MVPTRRKSRRVGQPFLFTERRSEMEVGFQEQQLAVGIARVDVADDRFAPRFAVVNRGAEHFVELVVGAQIPDVGEAASASAG